MDKSANDQHHTLQPGEPMAIGFALLLVLLLASPAPHRRGDRARQRAAERIAAKRAAVRSFRINP